MNRPWLGDGPARAVPYEDRDVIEFDLLRHAHAIDKGLLLADRRPGFGAEKVRCVVRMMRCMKLCTDADVRLIGWAAGILRTYGEVLGSDIASTDPSKEQMSSLLAWADELDEAMREFEECETFEPSAPTHNAISPIYFSRRSVRRWEDRQVDDETLRTLVEAAAWAPTSCNRQPYRFLFLRNPGKKKLAVEAAVGGRGFADKAPVVVVLLNDVRAYYAPHERHLAYVDTALAAENFVLAAHELGLGTVFLSMAVEDTSMDARFCEALGIPDWYATVALIALGYTKDASECGLPIRRSIDSMMLFDGFGEQRSSEG